jgi:hypothetical protein
MRLSKKSIEKFKMLLKSAESWNNNEDYQLCVQLMLGNKNLIKHISIKENLGFIKKLAVDGDNTQLFENIKKTLSILDLVRLIAETTTKNGLYAFLKNKGIKYSTIIVEFGLDGKKNSKAKEDWLNTEEPNEVRLHYHSQGIRSGGWSYNRLRGMKIIIEA